MISYLEHSDIRYQSPIPCLKPYIQGLRFDDFTRYVQKRHLRPSSTMSDRYSFRDRLRHNNPLTYRARERGMPVSRAPSFCSTNARGQSTNVAQKATASVALASPAVAPSLHSTAPQVPAPVPRHSDRISTLSTGGPGEVEEAVEYGRSHRVHFLQILKGILP